MLLIPSQQRISIAVLSCWKHIRKGVCRALRLASAYVTEGTAKDVSMVTKAWLNLATAAPCSVLRASLWRFFLICIWYPLSWARQHSQVDWQALVKWQSQHPSLPPLCLLKDSLSCSEYGFSILMNPSLSLYQAGTHLNLDTRRSRKEVYGEVSGKDDLRSVVQHVFQSVVLPQQL